jgi:signal peptidase I
MKKYKYRVKPWMLPVGLTLNFVLILRFVLLVGYVPTPSMEPTLRQNSIIVGTRLFGELKTGDIIVFPKDGVLVVKRIAGCPGERIDLTKISYMDSFPIPIFEQEVITVPENAYFVLGDNSQNSWDSRYWDEPFISAGAVVAKVLFLKK